MPATTQSHRIAFYVALMGALLLALFAGALNWEAPPGTKGKRRSGLVESSVVNAPAAERVTVAAPAAGFSPQVQLGYNAGDGWEPAIAADRLGNVFVLYPQYLGVPGCPEHGVDTVRVEAAGRRGDGHRNNCTRSAAFGERPAPATDPAVPGTV